MANNFHAGVGEPSAWQRGHSWRVPVRDLPWRRLPWILPLSIALWVLALWAFGRFIASPAPPPEPPPLDTRIIELPPDPPPAPAPPPPAPTVKPPPAPPVVPKAPTPPQPRLAPAPKPQEPAPAQAPVQPPPAAAAPAPQPETPPPAPVTNGSPGQGRTGAYAITKPEVKIPEDLIDEAARYSVTVRFRIAADGSVTVELDPPTPNPRLNRLYLEGYKAWKWFPATEAGQPVASTQAIRPVVK